MIPIIASTPILATDLIMLICKNRIWVSLSVIAVCLTLFGCQNYQVSVNEREVYRPKTVITSIDISDPALATCVHQHIKDQQVKSVRDLTQLLCSSAGVESVAHLNQFLGLTQLNLADNQIRSLTGLEGLAQLTHVNLANNKLAELQPLLTLPHLQWLDLSGNKEAACRDIAQLGDQVEVIAPAHCR